jgi:hypothetical protein
VQRHRRAREQDDCKGVDGEPHDGNLAGGGNEGTRERGNEGRREGGKKGRREGGKKEGRRREEGRREGGKEGRREGGKEGRREKDSIRCGHGVGDEEKDKRKTRERLVWHLNPVSVPTWRRNTLFRHISFGPRAHLSPIHPLAPTRKS